MYDDPILTARTVLTQRARPEGLFMTIHNEIFREFIAAHERALPFLPIVHTTTVTRFGEILQDNKLQLNLCKYYKKSSCICFMENRHTDFGVAQMIS
jgi:hypothetical protein